MQEFQTIDVDDDGRIQIKRIRAISAVFPNVPEEIDIKLALEKIEAKIKEEATKAKVKVDQNAFNNARGEWFEMLLAAKFFNLARESKRFCVFTIPNVLSVNYIDFFSEDVRSRIGELEKHLLAQGIELKMSNPDFLCVDLSKINRIISEEIINHPPITKFDTETAEFLENLHKLFIGECPFGAIAFAVSAKTSVRPDRRYQFVHEGNVIKAITAHLQTRYWDTNTSIGYFALTNKKPTKPDYEVMKTAAISSITNVFAKSVKAVDEIFWIQNMGDVEDFFKKTTSS